MEVLGPNWVMMDRKTDFELLVEPHRQRQEQEQGRKGAVSGISRVRVGIWLLAGGIGWEEMVIGR